MIAEGDSGTAPVAAADRRERTDEELSRLGSAGLEALFARHHAALYRFCLTVTKHGDEAADAMQTVWERALVTFSSRRGAVQKVRPWLYAVARNECLDTIRARGATRTLDVSDVEVAGGVSPEDCFEQRAELALLLDDLDELSERQRSALILRELAGLEGQQIAAALGTSAPRALGLVAEARRGLIERRSGRGMPCASAQHELTRMRRRSRGVQAHLEHCAECQSFERSRRGRSLSSLAISPLLLLVQGMGERISALALVAPQGIVVKASAAAALAVGSIGLMDPAGPASRGPHQKAAIPSSAAKQQGPSTPHSPASKPPVRTSGSTRPVRHAAAAPRARVTPGAPAAATPLPQAPAATAAPEPAPPPAAPAPAPPRAGDDRASSATGDAPHAVVPKLARSADATVDRALAASEDVSSGLQRTVDTALSLLRR